MDPIVHICKRSEWKAAQREGIYSPRSFQVEGFIHFSQPEQAIKVANLYFAGEVDLVLLWIDPKRLASVLRFEESDGDLFPHVYGPLNLDAVVAVVAFLPDDDGFFRNLPRPE